LQNNFHTLKKTLGFCKGAVISIEADFVVNSNFGEIMEYFLEN